LAHSLLAAGIPFALFPASPTPYELKHLVKVSKVKKIFTSPRNLENARIAAEENGFSESDGIFILEGEVKGQKSFDDLVRSVKEPAKDYAKPVGKEALAYLVFSSGTTGPPKGDTAMDTILLPVLIPLSLAASSRHAVTQEYHGLNLTGLHLGGTKPRGCTGQSPTEPSLAQSALTAVVDPPFPFLSPRGTLEFRSHWPPSHFTTAMASPFSSSVCLRFQAPSSPCQSGTRRSSSGLFRG
jgi:hypothetical protein